MDVIDTDKLAMLRDLSDGNDDLVREMLDSYIPMAEEQLLKMKVLDDSSDIDTLRNVIHNIKGATLNLGLQAMSIKIQEFQDRIKSGNYSDFVRQIDDMLESLQEIKNFRISL